MPGISLTMSSLPESDFESNELDSFSDCDTKEVVEEERCANSRSMESDSEFLSGKSFESFYLDYAD